MREDAKIMWPSTQQEIKELKRNRKKQNAEYTEDELKGVF